MYSDKNKFDKFYTKPKIAELCIEQINNLEEFEQIIEPSVGSGSFYNILKKQKNKCNRNRYRARKRIETR